MITAVFFDLYGTLANFQPSRFEVQSQACLEFGIKITEEGTIRGYKLADAYMSKENSIFPISTRSKNQRDQFFWEYEKLILEGNDVTVSIEMAGSIWNTLRKIPYKLVLFPDVVPEINKIKTIGIKTALISNIDSDNNNIIDELGLAQIFDVTITSNKIGATKPDPIIFNAALEQTGSIPENTIHIGDQILSDIQGALNSGIKPILIDRDRNHIGYTEHPRIESLSELHRFIGEI